MTEEVQYLKYHHYWVEKLYLIPKRKSCDKSYCLKCWIIVMTYYFKTSLKCYLYISSVPILMPMCDNFSDKPNNTNIYIYIYIFFFIRKSIVDHISVSRMGVRPEWAVSAPSGTLLRNRCVFWEETVATNPYNATTFNQGFSCYNWAQKLSGVQIMKNLGRWVDTREHFNRAFWFLIYWFLKWASN